MGFISNIVFYKIGRRRGYKRAAYEFDTPEDTCDPECVNYGMFCRAYGSCDGQQCEYE